MNLTLKQKIAISFAGLILASGLVATIAGVHFLGSGVLREAQHRVQLDLNSAHEIYQNRLQHVRTILEFTALRENLQASILSKDRSALDRQLREVRKKGRIDILNVTDAAGRVIVRSAEPGIHGDDQSEHPLVRYVLKEKSPISSTELVPAADLRREGPGLAERAHITLVPTELAVPTDQKEESRGLLAMAAYPVMHKDKLLGVIYGGYLLNRQNDLVDKIKGVVYSEQTPGGMDIGTVTIFQRDLRIATNVMNSDGQRAIGTRVSGSVNEEVLVKGHNWVGEAFVVNDWYITAYEPIRNLSGEIIGMLYVGILRRPYDAAKWRVVLVFLAIALLGTIGSLVVTSFVAGRIARPIRRLRHRAQQIAGGDYSQDIHITSKDVVGELADAFNTMTKKLLQQRQELENWVKTLEDKVKERTDELEGIHKELMHIEKMASVGRLAAGVAHEINNPLTGILTNATLLLEDTPEGNQQYDDLKTIVDETIRCRKTVKDLLVFSRQTKPEKTMLNIHPIIDNTCLLIRNQVTFKHIEIKKDFAEKLPRLLIDKDQITQVLMNILLNAADAMNDDGRILIRTRLADDGGHLHLFIRDNGSGIEQKDLKHIFDPFFSTKAHGTGLGLAISYGIVRQHGGTIEIESKVGEGTTFHICFPVPNEAKATG